MQKSEEKFQGEGQADTSQTIIGSNSQPVSHESNQPSCSLEYDYAAQTLSIDPAQHVSSSPQTQRIGDFTILQEIGRGGMGVVYEAFQESLRRPVALKMLPLSGRMDQKQLQRFRNEALAAAQLNHPNIVPVYSVGSEAGCHYYAMQLIQGRDVAYFIRQARSAMDTRFKQGSADTPALGHAETLRVWKGRDTGNRSHSGEDSNNSTTLPHNLAETLEIMLTLKSSGTKRDIFTSIVQIGIQAAEALHHAHQLGVVHRDIKPSNLMIDEQGKLWVTDFGLAQVQGAAALTMTGEILGTLRYMSPEQPLGQRVLVDQRTDIYSLGVTLYELLTLQKAFNGDTPKEIIRQVCFDEPVRIRRRNPAVPEDLETIVQKAISKNPDDRYQTAREFQEDLDRFLKDLPILARRPTLIQRGRRWGRRNVALATSLMAGITFLCLISMAAAGIILNSLSAETQQRKRAENLLDRSEGLRLTANSALLKEENPGLSLILAVRGAELDPGVEANSAILNSFDRNHELRAFSPRKEPGDSIALSPDGRRIVTCVTRQYAGKGEFPAIESELKTGKLLQSYDDGTSITSSTYSPNGNLLLTVGYPSARAESDSKENSTKLMGTPSLWSVDNGQKLFTFNETTIEQCTGAEFSPDSRLLALPGIDHSLKVYDVSNGRVSSSFKGHAANIRSISFSSDGKRILSVSEDNMVYVWETSTGTQLRSFPPDSGITGSIEAVFVAGSEQFAISSSAGTKLLEISSGNQLNDRHWPEKNASISRDGRRIALYSKYGKKVTIRDSSSHLLLSAVELNDFLVAAEFSDDSENLLITTLTEGVVVRTGTGAVLCTLRGHTDMVSAARMDRPSEHVVTASRDGVVKYWSVLNGAKENTIADSPSRVQSFPWTFSKDSARTATAVQAETKTELRNTEGMLIASGFTGATSGRFSSTGPLVTASLDEVVVWNKASTQRIAVLDTNGKKVRQAQTVPGTDIIVVHFENGGLTLWNTITGKKISLDAFTDRVSDFVVHPKNGSLLLTSAEGDCLLIDAVSGNQLKQFPHRSEVRSVHFSPSGEQFATLDSLHTARIWSINADEPQHTLQEPGVRMSDAVWSADGRFVLTWDQYSANGVCSWNLETGMPIRKLAAIAPSGVALHQSAPTAIVTSISSGTRLWNWETGVEKVLTEAPSTQPAFHAGRIITVEGKAGFRLSDRTILGYRGRPEFANSSLVIRDAETGNSLVTQQLSGQPSAICLDPSSGEFAFTIRTHDVEIRELSDRAPAMTIGNHAAPVTFQAFVGDKGAVVCASMDGTISMWDGAGHLIQHLREHHHPILSAALSSDSLRMASFDESGFGILWDVRNGQKLLELKGQTGAISVVQFSRSGKSLLTVDQTGSLLIRDLISRTEQRIALDRKVSQAQWSPDEKQVLVVVADAAEQTPSRRKGGRLAGEKVVMVDVESGKQTVLIHEGRPSRVAFHPDGKQFAVMSFDGAVSLHDVTAGQPESQFPPNQQTVFDLAFSPEGDEILLMHSKELSLWRLKDFTEVLRVPSNDNQYFDPEMRMFSDWKPFSPDGRWIVSATPQLRKWPRNPLLYSRSRVPRPLTDSEKRQFTILEDQTPHSLEQ